MYFVTHYLVTVKLIALFNVSEKHGKTQRQSVTDTKHHVWCNSVMQNHVKNKMLDFLS